MTTFNEQNDDDDQTRSYLDGGDEEFYFEFEENASQYAI